MRELHLWGDARRMSRDALQRLNRVAREFPGEGVLVVHLATTKGPITVKLLGVEASPVLAKAGLRTLNANTPTG